MTVGMVALIVVAIIVVLWLAMLWLAGAGSDFDPYEDPFE